jgi:hypothetical protein
MAEGYEVTLTQSRILVDRGRNPPALRKIGSRADDCPRHEASENQALDQLARYRSAASVYGGSGAR